MSCVLHRLSSQLGGSGFSIVNVIVPLQLCSLVTVMVCCPTVKPTKIPLFCVMLLSKLYW